MLNLTTRWPQSLLMRVDLLGQALSKGAPKALKQADTMRLVMEHGLGVMEPANGIRPPPEAA